MSFKKGDKLVVEYTGSFEDGTIFDSTEKQGSPLEFEFGAGAVIPGFENAFMDMDKGDEKDIRLEPADAYGDRDETLVWKLPRKVVPEDIKKNMVYLMGFEDGTQVPAVILDIDDEEVTIDLNNPLSGKILLFKVKLVDIKDQ